MLPNGNIEIGVHIADVTHFVHAGSAMDEEASRRSTTVYLVDKRVDMLPKPLTEDICRCEHTQDSHHEHRTARALQQSSHVQRLLLFLRANKIYICWRSTESLCACTRSALC